MKNLTNAMLILITAATIGCSTLDPVLGSREEINRHSAGATVEKLAYWDQFTGHEIIDWYGFNPTSDVFCFELEFPDGLLALNARRAGSEGPVRAAPGETVLLAWAVDPDSFDSVSRIKAGECH